MTSETLRLLVDAPISPAGLGLAVRPSLEDLKKFVISKSIELDVNALARDLDGTLSSVFNVLGGLTAKNDQYAIREVTFTLAVDSDGKISILSTANASVGTRIGFSFTITRARD